VWVTLRNCTYRTVLSTSCLMLVRMLKSEENSRKGMVLRFVGGSSFVATSQSCKRSKTLQMEWEKVEYSTSWKLELCHRPIPPTPEQLSQSNGVTKNQETDGQETPDVSPFFIPRVTGATHSVRGGCPDTQLIPLFPFPFLFPFLISSPLFLVLPLLPYQNV